MLNVARVSKSYGHGLSRVEALVQVDLVLEAGEMACLYGASGSGKTTLLNVVSGLDTPDSGQVLVGSVDLASLSESRRAAMRLREIGVVFQEGNLIRELSAWENVALPLMGQGIARASAREQAMAALELVGVAELSDRCPPEMSGGQRQRVGIARGLAGERRLLVTDEPTGALDTKNSERLFGLLRDLAEQQAIAILVATHDPLGREFATRNLEIRDGRVR